MKPVKELNRIQKEYTQAKRDAIARAHKIERLILDLPAAAEGSEELLNHINSLNYQLSKLFSSFSGAVSNE